MPPHPDRHGYDLEVVGGESCSLSIQIDCPVMRTSRCFQFARGACELSKARGGASGELQQHADHPPETDPDIPHDGRSLVKHDHTYRHERCKGGEVSWSRLSEQNFRVDKWSLCRG